LAVVVSDTSPIRALAHIDRLALLQDLFGEVLVPPAVVAELESPKSNLPPLHVRHLPFVRIQSPTDRVVVNELLTTLHAGESEAIALALEVHAEAVLIDEAEARNVAMERGLDTIGVLGILLRAKRKGLLGSIKPVIDQLEDGLDFFVSARLRAEVLKEAGENE
jgi:uncharacterized protein